MGEPAGRDRIAQEEALAVAAPPSSSTASRQERFGHMLAHELRNRINSAEISLQQLEYLMLQRAAETGRERELVGRVRAAVQGIVTLAEGVRALVASDSVSGAPLPLDQVVRHATKRLSALAEQRGVHVEIAPELPALIVDSGRLELVLSNLLTNSINHLDAEKGEHWVRIGAHRLEEEGAWRIEVADNGVGIPESVQPQVFELFFRGPDPPVPGSGLGLAIAEGAVRQLGGRMWLESEEGRGTTFFFTVPPGEPAVESS